MLGEKKIKRSRQAPRLRDACHNSLNGITTRCRGPRALSDSAEGSCRRFVDEGFENPHERSQLRWRQFSERKRLSSHLSEQLRTDSRTRRGELQDFHAAVLPRGLPPHQTSRFEAINQAGDVRGVTRQRIGQPAHRKRPARFDQVQYVALNRGQIERRPIGR